MEMLIFTQTPSSHVERQRKHYMNVTLSTKSSGWTYFLSSVGKPRTFASFTFTVFQASGRRTGYALFQHRSQIDRFRPSGARAYINLDAQHGVQFVAQQRRALIRSQKKCM